MFLSLAFEFLISSYFDAAASHVLCCCMYSKVQKGLGSNLDSIMDQFCDL